ncbi:MAG: acetyl-CoA carboxylase biotin carboxylase subunit [Bacteroidota bacterium]
MSKKIHTILIANRGEIASRVIRTCRKMGIATVAVFSEADRHAPFVQDADMAVYIGESEPAKSYLDQDKLITAAKRTGAEAIHPGYGFLSENAGFARRCKEEGIIFIGPNPEAIEAMGSKSKAKALMEAHKVPVVPGYKGDDQSVETLVEEAQKIGYPLLLKATAGGGGKGMRIVGAASELEAGIAAAKREALSAFGDDELLIEKYIESGRHIEFQIFGDQHQNVIHLLERECTIQRRYQKVIEESPSPVLTEDLRTQMGQTAVNAAKALNYDNAGTVEFIFDDKTQAFYFLEVNTRLQVEHPVTEAITGLDLVQMQIESAQGKALSISQEEVQGKGYAIEARLYAEDPANDFVPVTGKIHRFSAPKVEGLRVESAVESGSEISIYYDPMIAKIIMWGENRQAAHSRLGYVLDKLVCQGTTTNLSFLRHLLTNEDFLQGKYDTHFIDNKLDLKEISSLSAESEIELAVAVLMFRWAERQGRRKLLRNLPSGWRSNFYEAQKESYLIGEDEIALGYRMEGTNFHIQVGEQEIQCSLAAHSPESISLNINGLQRSYSIIQNGNDFFIHSQGIGNHKLTLKDRFPQKEKEKVKGGYVSPMPSQIVKVHVAEGANIKKGDPLLVLSSMKMESTLLAEEDGTLEEVFVSEGQNVEAGFLLLKIQEN